MGRLSRINSQHIIAAAVRAYDAALILIDMQENFGMTERSAAAIAGDRKVIHMNDFKRLHGNGYRISRESRQVVDITKKEEMLESHFVRPRMTVF